MPVFKSKSYSNEPPSEILACRRLLLLGFGWLAYQGASTAPVQSAAVEDKLNLRVIEPVLTRYNAQGQIESVLTAPDALTSASPGPQN